MANNRTIEKAAVSEVIFGRRPFHFLWRKRKLSRRKKEKVEFRYYELPPGIPLLALLGEKWIHSANGQKKGDCLHFHNYMEVGFCYSGNGEMFLENAEYSQRFEGDMFSIIPKSYPHATVNEPDTESSWEYLFIDTDNFLREQYADNPRKAQELIRRISKSGQLYHVNQLPVMAGIIRHIIELMRNVEEYYLNEVKSLLLALLLEIARVNVNETENRTGPEKYQPMISMALDYISDNFAQEIRIQDLAQRCHISETHFRRVFHACMQMPPAEYINLVRIRMACELMQKTNDSMSVIANRTGFDVLSTFNRNFKKIMGVSPSEWRRSSANYEGKLLNCDVKAEEGW